MQDIFYLYTHLPLAGMEVVCPYWIDNHKKLKFGPGGGKGSPQDIVNFTKAKALEKRIDLNKLNGHEIVSFMKKNKIGVDCSGFAFWLLNALDLEKGGNGLVDDIPNIKGRFIEIRASTEMLTNRNICLNIEKVNEIKPGDMIRLKKGHHLAVVIETERNKESDLKKIVYAHSSSPLFTVISGVHKETIIIKDPSKPLQDQDWQEQTPDGSNYADTLYFQEGDGVKRLKIWQ